MYFSLKAEKKASPVLRNEFELTAGRKDKSQTLCTFDRGTIGLKGWQPRNVNP